MHVTHNDQNKDRGMHGARSWLDQNLAEARKSLSEKKKKSTGIIEVYNMYVSLGGAGALKEWQTWSGLGLGYTSYTCINFDKVILYVDYSL